MASAANASPKKSTPSQLHSLVITSDNKELLLLLLLAEILAMASASLDVSMAPLT